jgi:predicted hotdog family 3-hydroxylacyl-ACP dehydratase
MSDCTFSIEELVPHAKPMLMVDRIVVAAEDYGQVASRIVESSPLFGPEGLMAAAYMELIAQAEAALQGWRQLQTGLPIKAGYLVGVRNLEVVRQAQEGDELLISVRTTATIGGFRVVEGLVKCGESVMARGNLKLFLVDPDE